MAICSRREPRWLLHRTAVNIQDRTIDTCQRSEASGQGLYGTWVPKNLQVLGLTLRSSADSEERADHTHQYLG